MHRLIMNSETYKMASSFYNAVDAEKDPTNTYLWRFPIRRLYQAKYPPLRLVQPIGHRLAAILVLDFHVEDVRLAVDLDRDGHLASTTGLEKGSSTI